MNNGFKLFCVYKCDDILDEKSVYTLILLSKNRTISIRENSFLIQSEF